MPERLAADLGKFRPSRETCATTLYTRITPACSRQLVPSNWKKFTESCSPDPILTKALKVRGKEGLGARFRQQTYLQNSAKWQKAHETTHRSLILNQKADHSDKGLALPKLHSAMFYFGTWCLTGQLKRKLEMDIVFVCSIWVVNQSQCTKWKQLLHCSLCFPWVLNNNAIKTFRH